MSKKSSKKATKAKATGRPPKKYGRHNHPIGCKLTDEEKRRFDEAAEAAQMIKADFLRDAVRRAVERVLGPEPPAENG